MGLPLRCLLALFVNLAFDEHPSFTPLEVNRRSAFLMAAFLFGLSVRKLSAHTLQNESGVDISDPGEMSQAPPSLKRVFKRDGESVICPCGGRKVGLGASISPRQFFSLVSVTGRILPCAVWE
jgi:hypothetical protein